MSGAVVDQLRLVGVAGSNKVMAGELSRLAQRASLAERLAAPKKEGLGALVYPFDADLAALAVRYHRTSARVLWDLFQSDAKRLEPLYGDLRSAAASDDRPWLAKRMGISVSAYGVAEFAAGERQIVGTVKNALIDGAAARGSTLVVEPEKPDVHLGVRLHAGVVTVSIDLAGRPMNQRGYRVSGGEAPLREDLAAMLVMLARHDARRESLFDPMAGTGTIAIEAACMAEARPVWVPPRRPACASLDPFRRRLAAKAEPLFADTRPVVIVNEIDAERYALCRQHVKRAGVEAFVECRKGDFREVSRDSIAARAAERGLGAERGLILCNPPYGERLADPEIGRLYRDLGAYCRSFRGWRAGFIVANREFEPAFGGRPRIKKPLSNGPLRGYFLLYDL
jgi:23S rRNA G2445 N2-methylase RlmL